MTLEQIQMVQASFAKIAPIVGPAAALFYQRLFTLDPTLAVLFTGDMRKQERKLISMIGTADIYCSHFMKKLRTRSRRSRSGR